MFRFARLFKDKSTGKWAEKRQSGFSDLDTPYDLGGLNDPTETFESDSSADVPDKLCVAIQAILDKDSSETLIDEMARVLSASVDRDVLLSVYTMTASQCESQTSLATRLAARFTELGLGTEDCKPEASDLLDLSLRSDSESSALSPITMPFTCPVCLDEFHDGSSIFTFLCGLDCEVSGPPHALCFDCASEHVQSGGADVKCYDPGCSHELLMNEIALIFGRGDMAKGQASSAYQVLDERKRDHSIAQQSSDFAQCPGPDCAWIVARSCSGAADRAICGLCSMQFCSNCSELYHFRTTCAEFKQRKSSWHDWILSGRKQYWKQDSKKNSKAEAAAIAQERERVARITDLEARDEAYKAKHCRHCPHCQRLVERLSGCSIMRCGYDTDTKANVQNGCQERFDWDKARRYKPVQAGKSVQFSAKSETDKKSHMYWQCDACSNEVKGLRFECMNCSCFSLCERCENKESMNHFSGQHYFRIHEAV